MAKSKKSFTNVSPMVHQVKQKDPFVMGHSIKVYLNKGKTRSSDGLSPVYLRCIINRKKFEKSLALFGNAKTFDEKTGRFRGNQHDANLIIESELDKIRKIIVKMRLSDQSLHRGTVRALYNRVDSNEDFIQFIENYATTQWDRGAISKGRKDRYFVVARKLRAFTAKGKLPFNEVSKDFIEEFKANEKKYLAAEAKANGRPVVNTINSLGTTLKIVKKACKEAVVANYMLNNPFANIEISGVNIPKESLKIEEVHSLVNLYKKRSLNPMLQESLAQFIFAIFTGVRFSDLKRIGKNDIKDGILIFIAKKTKNHGTRARVPLLDICLEIIKDRPSPFFHKYQNQPFNRNLKLIAIEASIGTAMTAHTARHTFISMYLRAGGKVQVAQQFTALTNMKQVFEYNQVFDDELLEEIQRLNKILS